MLVRYDVREKTCYYCENTEIYLEESTSGELIYYSEVKKIVDMMSIKATQNNWDYIKSLFKEE